MPTESTLPKELWVEIFKLLSIKDRLSLAKTSQFFAVLSREKIIWSDDYKKLRLTVQPDQDIKSFLLKHLHIVPVFFVVYEYLKLNPQDHKMWNLLTYDISRTMYLSIDEVLKSPPENIKGFYQCYIREPVLLRTEKKSNGHCFWRKKVTKEMVYSYISLDKSKEIKNPNYKNRLDDVLASNHMLNTSLGAGFSR